MKLKRFFFKNGCFNLGLYERALSLTEGRTDGITWRVPLSLLTPYFSLSFLLPQKRLVELCFTRNEASKVIIKAADVTDKYDLEVTEITLDLGLILLEANVRRSYYDLIAQQKLMRALSTQKPSHFNLAKGNYFKKNSKKIGKNCNILVKKQFFCYFKKIIYNYQLGLQVYYLPYAINFGQIPDWIVLILMDESQHLGKILKKILIDI